MADNQVIESMTNKLAISSKIKRCDVVEDCN